MKSRAGLLPGGLLLLVYLAIVQDEFSIGIIIIFLGPLFYRASLLLNKPNHGVLLNSLFIGIWLFIFFPGLLSIFAMAMVGLRMNNHHNPTSIRPRLLADRNLGPFAILSLIVVKSGASRTRQGIKTIPIYHNTSFMIKTSLHWF